MADAVREAVEAGAAESRNALVERAVLRFLAEARREALYASYAEAAQDPAFMADMRAMSSDFDTTVADGLPEHFGIAFDFEEGSRRSYDPARAHRPVHPRFI